MKKIVLLAAILVALTMCFSTVKAATQAQIDSSIEKGLAWLAAKQNTAPGPDFGSWGVAKKPGKTGLAVKKFEHDAILKGFSSPFDTAYPYHMMVERGLNYLFRNMVIEAIWLQPYGDPDTDGDSIAVSIEGETYYTGIVLMAIVETNTPDRVVDDSGSAVYGWTYYDVAVDMMNWLAFGQVDAGTQEGSWGYGANGGGDQSNSGYATLGLGFCEASAPHGFSLSVPQFVKNELNLWIDYIQIDVPGSQFDGGSAYYQNFDTLPGYQTVNILQTGNLLFEMAWYGDDTTTQRVMDAIAYIVRHWTDGGYSWPGPQGWHGNYQAMFTMMKGLEAFQIDLIDGIDWFDEVSDTIVATQHANGSWGPDVWDCWPGVGCDTILSTCWALLTLQKVTPELVITINLDIKPQSCPNPFNMGSKGVLPVAILGTEDFDVMTVDPSTLLLEGVAPIRWSYEDVATPVGPDADTCECTTAGADGYMDLTLKFDHQAIAAALGPVTDREVRVLTITGMTYDSIPIMGKDCVVIIKKKGSQLSSGPATVSLGSAYPNPFNPETEISFSLSERTQVSLIIYNILGEKVKTLVNKEMDAGTHTIRWNSRDEAGNSVSSGIYFYRLKTDGFDQTRKMLLMK
jgi:hypothetical protein